jgi:hypothetical protein
VKTVIVPKKPNHQTETAALLVTTTSEDGGAAGGASVGAPVVAGATHETRGAGGQDLGRTPTAGLRARYGMRHPPALSFPSRILSREHARRTRFVLCHV